MLKLGVRSLIFGLCWLLWSAFSILWLGPEVSKHQLNAHRALIAWVLCVIPLVVYVVVLLVTSKSQARN